MTPMHGLIHGIWNCPRETLETCRGSTHADPCAYGSQAALVTAGAGTSTHLPAVLHATNVEAKSQRRRYKVVERLMHFAARLALNQSEPRGNACDVSVNGQERRNPKNTSLRISRSFRQYQGGCAKISPRPAERTFAVSLTRLHETVPRSREECPVSALPSAAKSAGADCVGQRGTSRSTCVLPSRKCSLEEAVGASQARLVRSKRQQNIQQFIKRILFISETRERIVLFEQLASNLDSSLRLARSPSLIA